MTPDQWLQNNGKKPWHTTDLYDNWYWATYLYYHGKILTEEEVEPDEKDYTIPIPIWDNLQARTTYPYVKMYRTEHECLEDFRQAFHKAIEKGWKPE